MACHWKQNIIAFYPCMNTSYLASDIKHTSLQNTCLKIKERNDSKTMRNALWCANQIHDILGCKM